MLDAVIDFVEGAIALALVASVAACVVGGAVLIVHGAYTTLGAL